MTFYYEGFEIEVSAKKTYRARKNKKDTLSFLNCFAVLLIDRERLYEKDFEEHPERTYYGGEHGVIKQNRDAIKHINEILDSNGAFKDLYE